MAALTAALSFIMPVVKEAIKLALASVIHGSRSNVIFFRIIVWNRSTSFRASVSAGAPASIAATVTDSALLNWSRTMVINRAIVLAEGTFWSC
jgi:hypothetical protein